MNKIITIARQFGSGGREFGRRLALELGYEYYDKEIISEISKKTSLSEEYISDVIENKPHQLYPITIGRSIGFSYNIQTSQMQSIFEAQCSIISELANKSNCVIVGRCADYILQDMKPFRIFIYSDIDSKIQRCIERDENKEEINIKKLKKQIINMDKNRKKYYEFFTGLEWGNPSNYDLCINTTNQNIKEIVPIIAKMFK